MKGGFLKMKSLNIFLLVMLVAAGGVANAQRNEILLKEIAEHYRNIKTQSAHFVQIKHISFLEDSLVSKGEFYFKEPDKMVWKYNTPFLYKVVINGDSVMIRDNEKTHGFDAAENMLFLQIKQVIFNMVSGRLLSDDGYSIEAFDAGKYEEVHFTPKEETMKKYLKRIDLFFDKNRKEVVKIRMNESSGDITMIYFNNRKTNTGLSDDLFRP